jgi:hypothetical protein
MEDKTLNEVYDEVLGKGPAIEDLSAEAPPTGLPDGAYGQEDYSDDAEDGTDPRDPSTELSEEEEDLLGADDEFEDEEVDDDEYEDIPERLVEAGRTANLSERDIIELSETHPEALEALARSQEAAAVIPRAPQQSVAKETPADETPAEGFQPLKLDLTEDDREELGERSVTIIDSLVKKVNELGSKVQETGQATAEIRQQTTEERNRGIDDVFDKMSDDIPGLGKLSSGLSDEEKANRIFAAKTAHAAMQAYGNLTLEQALTKGASALRGDETKVKAKLVADLNRNKKRFISRGRGQKRGTPRKSVDERAVEAISNVLDDPKYHSHN